MAQRLPLFGFNETEPDRKRRRFGVSPLPFPNATQNSLNAFASTPAQPSNNLAASIASSAHSASTPSFQDPTPASASTPATSLLAGDNNMDGLPDPFPMYHPDYNKPGLFSDLDNLFDGFFDLSMPTMFQDPLFEGAAYFGPDDFGMMDGSQMDFQGQNLVVPELPTGIPGNIGMSTTDFIMGDQQGQMN